MTAASEGSFPVSFMPATSGSAGFSEHATCRWGYHYVINKSINRLLTGLLLNLMNFSKSLMRIIIDILNERCPNIVIQIITLATCSTTKHFPEGSAIPGNITGVPYLISLRSPSKLLSTANLLSRHHLPPNAFVQRYNGKGLQTSVNAND